MTSADVVTSGMQTSLFVYDDTAPAGTFTPRLAHLLKSFVPLLAPPDSADHFLFPAGTAFWGDGELTAVSGPFMGVPFRTMPEGVETIYADSGGLFLGYKRRLVALVTRNNKVILGGY